jgi:two-component system OmpR family sensor kinase
MSIFKKLSILFTLSLVVMIIIGVWIDEINSKRIDDLIKEKYLKVSNEILENIDNKETINDLIINYKLKKLI